MSGPWEKYKQPEAAAEGPWAKYKSEPAPEEVEESGFLDKITPTADTLPDLLTSIGDHVPVLGAAANYVGNKIDVAAGFAKDDAEAERNMLARQAARAERSPIADTAGAALGQSTAMIAPGAGLAGMFTGLGVSAADLGARKVLNNEEISGKDAAGQLGLELGMGLAGAGLGKVGSKLLDTDWYRGKALNAAKKTLGGTKKELEKLDVRSDALDNSANRLLDEGVFDKPFQSKQDIFDTITAKKAQSGEAGGELFTATAKPANQAATYDQLMTRAQVARNKGQKEIADKLESEAKIIRDIDSVPTEGGRYRNAGNFSDEFKLSEMQNTELDPEILKGRKTTLDKQAYGTMGTNDPAASAAANEMRDMQYGLLDDDAASFLKEENKRFGELATAEKLAAKSAAGEISNGGGLIGNVKKGVGSTAGAMIGNALLPGGVGAAGGMAAGGYAAKLLQDHGSQLAAYGFNKASKVLQNEGWAKTLSQAGERGGSQGVSTAHFLLTQRDPAYRKAHQEDQEAERNK